VRIPGGSPRGISFALGFARRALALSTPVVRSLPLELVDPPGECPAPLAGNLLRYRVCVDLLAHEERSPRCRDGSECRLCVQHDVRSSLGIGRHCDDPALIGTTRLELRVYHGLIMDTLDFRKRGEPSISLLHGSLDPLFRIEGYGKATDALAASLFLLDLQKSVLFQKGKPARDGLPQLRSEAGRRSIHPESSIVFAHSLKGHEVKEGPRLGNGLEFGQTTMPGHLDENRSFTSLRRMDSAEGDDLSPHYLVLVPVLLDLWRLWHEVEAAVHALEHKKDPTSRLVLRSADDASTELHTRDELGELQRCMGIDQKLAVPDEALPEAAGQLDPLKRCAVVFGELEGALSDAPCEAETGQEGEPPQELQALLAGSLRARYGRLELDSSSRIRPAREHLVEVAILVRLDRTLAGSGEVALKQEAKRLGCELLASQPKSVPHIFPRQSELNSLFISAADHHMKMGMGSVEMRDSHPLEVNPEIPFCRRHEFACVFAEVESLAGFRRDDELPKARISCTLPPAEAVCDIDRFLVGVETVAGTAFLLCSFAREVTTMGAPVRAAAIRDPPYDDDASLKQRRREADEACARGRKCPSPAPRKTNRHLTQAARPARTRKLPGTRPHLEALALRILHRSHSSEQPRSCDLVSSLKVALQHPLRGAPPDRM